MHVDVKFYAGLIGLSVYELFEKAWDWKHPALSRIFEIDEAVLRWKSDGLVPPYVLEYIEDGEIIEIRSQYHVRDTTIPVPGLQ